MRRTLAVVSVLCLAFPAVGAARPLLGVHGGIDRFDQLTGQRSQVRHIFFGWAIRASTRTFRRADRLR